MEAWGSRDHENRLFIQLLEPVNAAIKLDSDKLSIMSNENCFLFISMLKLKTVKGLINSSAINRIRRILWYCSFLQQLFFLAIFSWSS